MSKTTVNLYQNSKNEKIAKIEFILTKLREACKGLKIYALDNFENQHFLGLFKKKQKIHKTEAVITISFFSVTTSFHLYQKIFFFASCSNC